MTRTALNLVLVAIAAALVMLLVLQLRRDVAPTRAPVARSEYVLREFSLVTLGDDGTESFTVRGPYLQRDVEGRSLSLVQPRFSFPHDDGRWNARADKAWVGPGADEVHLIDEVLMIGPPVPGQRRSRLETSRLVVFPEQRRAESDRRVTITRGNSILAGTGLKADLAARRYDLLSQVEGRYER